MNRRTRRWGRILSNTLTAISLLLAIATAGLWVRSYFYTTLLLGSFPWGYVAVAPGKQQPTRLVINAGPFGGLFYWSSGITDGMTNERRTTFIYNRPYSSNGPHPWFSYSRTGSNVVFYIHGSLLIVPLSTIPLIRLIAWRYRRKTLPGHCPVCGYDTRANPAKCSECGHEMPVTAKAKST